MNVSQAPTRLANTQFEKGKEHTHRTPKDEIDPCSNVREVLLPKSANRRSPRDSYYHQRKPGKHNKGARNKKLSSRFSYLLRQELNTSTRGEIKQRKSLKKKKPVPGLRETCHEHD